MHQAGLTRPPHPEEEKNKKGGRSKHSEQGKIKRAYELPERSAKRRGGGDHNTPTYHLGVSGRGAPFCMEMFRV